MNVNDDLNTVLSTLKFSGKIQFDGFYCDECCLPLEDYGCEPLIFGVGDSFSDRLLCYKCAADFFGEEDYHSEKLKDNFELTVAKHNKIENLVNIFPLSA